MCARATLTDLTSGRTVLDDPPPPGPLRTGVVGLGHRSVGNVLPKVMGFEEYELAAVCDLRDRVVETVCQRTRAEHGVEVNGYTSFGDMLSREQLDAVIVQVDPDKQVPLACQAMDAGCHVMMEVPAAYTIEDCWRLVVTVERTGRVFLLMEQLRYSGYIQAWRRLVQDGVIGRPLFAEGEYFDDKPDAFYQDAAGRFYTPRQAEETPDATPTWRHLAPTITYLPHELSPILHALDDRVVRVTGMSTRNRSYNYDSVERADMQVALMHTERDTILRMAVAHTVPGIRRGDLVTHWHHIKGTRGAVEWRRGDQEQCKLWVADWQLAQPLDVPWGTARIDGPPAAAASGHGGLDYYPFAVFADAALREVPVHFDVYQAVGTAAPAILAAQSAAGGSMPMDVPDFRPDAGRPAGQPPAGIAL